MPVILLRTTIAAPKERVFDLSRSIDAHRAFAHRTRERAVAGVTSGLLGPGEEVTWEATHFGVKQRLKVRMTRFDRPDHFQDVMVEGAFARMRHDHAFQEVGENTLMADHFEFSSPFGILGRMVDACILKGYMRRFLEERNKMLKATAESDRWKEFIR